MSTTVRLNNSARFNRSLISILEHSRKPAEEVMRKQARLVVEKMFDVTPPAGRSKRGVAAKKVGEKTVAGNIQKVLSGVPVSKNRSISTISEHQIAVIHTRARVAGRVRGKKRARGVRVLVPKQKLNVYIKKRQKAVGMLAAGWNKAASLLQARNRYWPSYVRRHSPPSDASVTVTKDRIRIHFHNKVQFAGGVDVMPRRLKWALGKQASNNEKIIAAFKGGAKRAGFRVV